MLSWVKSVTLGAVLAAFASPVLADCYTDPVGSVGTVGPCLNMLIVDRTMLLAAVADGSYDFKPSDAYTTHNDGITYTFADGPNRIFTGQVTSLSDLFRLKNFNQDIGYWDTSRVTNMFRTFAQSPFNQDISGWDTSNVTTMSQTFASNSAFNQNIGGWDTSSVTNMLSMFVDATSFNQNIGGWDVGSVTEMSNMFQGASAFNGNITTWDVRSVNDMSNMFRNAVSFNQDIRVWVLKSQTVLPYQTNMFLGATLMLQNYGFTATPTKAQFSAPDTTAPTLASSNPADNATGVAVGSNIVLTFSENIQAGTGNIVISDGAGDTRTIPVGDAQITIAGTTLTINPTADLNSSTGYYVQVAATAVDDLAGNSYAGITDTTTLNFTTATPPNSGPVAHAGPDQTVASAASVTLDGTGSTDADGDTLTYAWTQTAGTAVTLSSPAAAQPTFTAPTLNVGDADLTLVFSLVVNDGTVNSAADTVSITIQAPLPTPATVFAENASVIRQILVAEADRSLRSAASTNRLMVQDARQRFIDSDRNGVIATRNDIPFDVDGVFRLSGATLSTNGTFFGQLGSADGSWRRLFFGDFNVQRDANSGSNTATLSARVAWEQMVSETTMLGYFIGAELGDSDIKGSFTGDQNRVALTLGGYAVHHLAEQVYLDGFLTLGAGRNDLKMANAVLALDSDYTTRTATLGAAVSGIYEYDAYEFHPELSFSYGHTWIGNVGFTGRAYGLVDNTLSLNAGNVSMGNLIFRPEVIWGLDAASVADSHSQLSFAPRMICEQTRSTRRTEACGGGAELGLDIQSDDGLTNAEFRVLMDRVGSSERTSYTINFEHRF